MPAINSAVSSIDTYKRSVQKTGGDAAKGLLQSVHFWERPTQSFDASKRYDTQTPTQKAVKSVVYVSAESTLYGAPAQSGIVASLNNPRDSWTGFAKTVGKDMANPQFMGAFFMRNALVAGLDMTYDNLSPETQQAINVSPAVGSGVLAGIEAAVTAKLEYKELHEQTGQKFTPKPATLGIMTARNTPLYVAIDQQRAYLERHPDASPLAVAGGFSVAAAATSLPTHSLLVKVDDTTTLREVAKDLASKGVKAAQVELLPMTALGARSVSLLSLLYPMAKNTLNKEQ